MPYKKIKLIGFSGLIAFALFFVVTACKPQPININDAAKEVENVLLTTSHLVKVTSIDNKNTLGKVSGKPSKLYQITQELIEKQSTTLFPVNEYAPDFGPNVMENIKVKKICNDIKVVREKASDAEEWRKYFKGVTAEMTSSEIFGIKTKVATTRPDLIIDIVKKIFTIGTIPGKTKIFVRGFADRCNDSSNCNIGSLVDGYRYTLVDIHPFVDKNKRNPESSGYKEQTEPVSSSNPNGKFTNEHLPNLRANFFANEFLEKLVTNCEIPGFSKKIGILQGRVDPKENNNPGERKVEVYIALYPEKV